MAAQCGETEMNALSIDFPAFLTRLWIDNSIQIMKATTDLWSGLLVPTVRERSASSTTSPWWMPPQQMRAQADISPWSAAFGVWMPGLRQAMTLPMATGANSFLPWLPAARTASAGNPFALWEQMWLNATAPEAHAPWSAANASPVADGLWQPVAAAYRTASGHAMATVLRTMADVVEPKAQVFMPAHYWPSTLGTRH